MKGKKLELLGNEQIVEDYFFYYILMEISVIKALKRQLTPLCKLCW